MTIAERYSDRSCIFKTAKLPLKTVITADENWSRNSNGYHKLEVGYMYSTYIFGYMPDSIEIAMAIPMSLGSANTTGL